MGKWIGIGLAVLGIITIGFIVAGYIFPDWAKNTRDIAIVILAVFQLISVILMIALLLALMFTVFYIRRLARDTVIPEIRELRAKLDGVIEHTQAIAGTCQRHDHDSQHDNFLYGRASGLAGDSCFQPADRGARRRLVSGAAWPKVEPVSPIGPLSSGTCSLLWSALLHGIIPAARCTPSALGDAFRRRRRQVGS